MKETQIQSDLEGKTFKGKKSKKSGKTNSRHGFPN
jgi:hypothetical protein